MTIWDDLLAQLPAFNPSWSSEVMVAWFEAFKALAQPSAALSDDVTTPDEVEGKPAEPTPEAGPTRTVKSRARELLARVPVREAYRKLEAEFGELPFVAGTLYNWCRDWGIVPLSPPSRKGRHSIRHISTPTPESLPKTGAFDNEPDTVRDKEGACSLPSIKTIGRAACQAYQTKWWLKLRHHSYGESTKHAENSLMYCRTCPRSIELPRDRSTEGAE
jgi:hypothetical protein